MLVCVCMAVCSLISLLKEEGARGLCAEANVSRGQSLVCAVR